MGKAGVEDAKYERGTHHNEQALDVTGLDQVYYKSQGDEIKVKEETAGAGRREH